jgi:hypothetical protein
MAVETALKMILIRDKSKNVVVRLEMSVVELSKASH